MTTIIDIARTAHDPDANCYRWEVRASIDANTRITVRGETLTRAQARAAMKRWIRTIEALR